MKSSNETQNAPSESATRRQAKYRVLVKPYGHHSSSFYSGPAWGFTTKLDGSRVYYGSYVHFCGGDDERYAPTFDFRKAWTICARLRRCDKFGSYRIQGWNGSLFCGLLFFLSAVCFQTSMAAPTPLCNPNNVLGLVNSDGDLLPLGTGQPIEENLSVPVKMQNPHPAGEGSQRGVPSYGASIGTNTRQAAAPDAQNSLASENTTPSPSLERADGLVEKSHRGDTSASPSQNLQQPLVSRFLNENVGVSHTSGTDYTLGGMDERAISKETAQRDERDASAGYALKLKSNKRSGSPPAQNPACPQSKPLPIVSVYPKLSVADTYVRLLEVPRYFSIEPPILEGNKERGLWTKH